MAFARRGRASYLVTPGRVPTVPVEVDWSHPLANGLIACYVPGGTRGLVDLAGIGPRLTLGSGGAFGASSVGAALVSKVASANASSSSVPSAWKLTTAGTLFVSGDFLGSPAVGNAILWGLNFDPSGGTPFADYNVSVTFANGKTSFGYNAAGTNNTVFATTAAPTSGNHSVAAAFTVGGAISLYQDGASSGSGTWSGAAPTYTTPVAVMGGNPTQTTRIANTALTIALTYNRALSATEIAILDRSPFCMLRPTGRRGAIKARSVYSRGLQAASSPLSISARSTGLIRRGASAPVASIARSVLAPFQALASQVASAVKVKSIGLQAIAVQVATAARVVGLPIQSLAAQTAAVARSVGKQLVAGATQISSIVASHVGAVALQALAAQITSILQNKGKPIQASLSVASAASRLLGRSVSSATTPEVSVSRPTNKSVAASVSPVAALLHRAIGVTIQALLAVAASASVVSGGVFLQAFAAPVASTRRAVTKKMQAVGSAITTSVIPKLRSIAATCHPVAAIKISRSVIVIVARSPIASAVARFFARRPPQKITTMGFPQRGYPMVDPKTGLVNETWFRFLQVLWARTGGTDPE